MSELPAYSEVERASSSRSARPPPNDTEEAPLATLIPPRYERAPPSAGPPRDLLASLIPLQSSDRRRFYFVSSAYIAAILSTREVIPERRGTGVGLLNDKVNFYVPDRFTPEQFVESYLPHLVALPYVSANVTGTLYVNPISIVQLKNVKGTASLCVAAGESTIENRTWTESREFAIPLPVAVCVRKLDPMGFERMAQDLADTNLGAGNRISAGFTGGRR
ncbi:hypothetical protein HDU87_000605 [Geranomyces variabilis]|uniref:Uncharacterized protein n=1 Tax=Geranomyces variabilis TaxID=109894 RepID=A0AAD5XLQ0_9FUNG|nr:hypothetical protein HDU87_000605 [Geranomyces variabilis]